ncbi:DUF3072 domain-containing protein [Bradyrhizobium lablabi]|uniref:DUF3072 domain-containing protein n=1 Tax=Bradyrhizobium lablabi TaxID=722472 RepID=UPI0020120B4C|nr:DUF3072 domain-containing protein [Bradyrhizobium lablabi]
MAMSAAKFGAVRRRIGRRMTRSQAARLRSLATEAYQPKQYAPDLTFEEAQRRINVLKVEIALADSF